MLCRCDNDENVLLDVWLEPSKNHKHILDGAGKIWVCRPCDFGKSDKVQNFFNDSKFFFVLNLILSLFAKLTKISDSRPDPSSKHEMIKVSCCADTTMMTTCC